MIIQLPVRKICTACIKRRRHNDPECAVNMWLLDTASLELKYFQGGQEPSTYAILSHRWQDGEVTFEDIRDATSSYTLKRGWSKVTGCCNLARRYGFKYVWIDSCCIDKSSSAELSEAINRMYDWYADATICYTYLFDVHDARNERQFEESSWFTRSWTLQELLAPPEMHFYTSDWIRIGSRSDMVKNISKSTAIPHPVIERFNRSEHSVAERMRWAASRNATRPEDIAYSLLGIFDINIPLLYGEGTKAFQRLQEAIMSVSNDLSLFVWQGPCCPRSGMLAASPAAFCDFRCPALRSSRGYTFNNAGLYIDLRLEPMLLTRNLERVYAAYLRDPYAKWTDGVRIRLFLMKDQLLDQYRRVSVDGKTWDRGKPSDVPSRICQVFISKELLTDCKPCRESGFKVYGCPRGAQRFTRATHSHRLEPTFQPVPRDSQYLPSFVAISPTYMRQGIMCYIAWTRAVKRDFLIMCLGFDFDFRPICLALIFPGDSCRHPLDGLSSEVIMNKYSEILPESSTAACAKAQDPVVYAYRGQADVVGSPIDFPELNLQLSFGHWWMPVVDVYLSTHDSEPKMNGLVWPDRSMESKRELYKIFGLQVS